MKAKTIQKTLRAKFDRYVESITDPSVKELMKKNTMITGGSIVSMLLGEKVKDYDLYFRDYNTCRAVVEYYAKSFGDKISVEIIGDRISIRVQDNSIFKQEGEFADEEPIATEGKDPEFKPIYMSSNAITLTDEIQLVCRFYGEPEQIHENYDFIHCTCFWKSWDDELILPAAALESIITKELRYVGSKYPLCSLIRIRKFVARQWTINAGQILKMVMQLQSLDLTNIAVLQDQLVGVDSAYFAQILRLLEEKGTEKVDTAYLMTIIDRVF